ncbi:hypothetical protein YTPLAS18_00980 [Nitrospira sp.]|nr:hypothetical protein YTPLAS18_00980 [Nitrospira sp.]
MRIWLVLMFAMLPLLAEAAPSEGQGSTASHEVKGDVLYWEGEEVIVKEMSGNQVRVHVGPDTKIEGVAGGRLKSGDKVVATVNGEGHAQSIVLQIPK